VGAVAIGAGHGTSWRLPTFQLLSMSASYPIFELWKVTLATELIAPVKIDAYSRQTFQMIHRFGVVASAAIHRTFFGVL